MILVAKRRFGRRGITLVLFGLAWCGQGGRIICAPYQIEDTITNNIPLDVTGILWVGTGVLALICACTRWQWVGYGIAMIMPVTQAISHLPFMLTYDASVLSEVMVAIMWLSLSGALFVLSGWAETSLPCIGQQTKRGTK